tara:strand:- start:3921 stop:5405 length:1485 start_codon:yes stop_codon:yes gene_type:complete
MDSVIRFPADYNNNVHSEYQGNPFLEALPEMMESGDFFRQVMFLRPFDKSYRQEPAWFRNVKLVETYKYVVPNAYYYKLYKILWRMLFTTYTDRNSFDTESVTEHYSKLLHKQKMDALWTGTTGESLLFTAPSGIGKTMLVRRTLMALTQVIDHTEYRGKKFRQPQVLWIYLKIPSNANRKSLCHLFLEEIDKCVATDYAKKTPMTTQIGNYERIFRTIIETYKLGLLVIDELQNLSVCKAGGDQEFLNFFSELSEQWRLGLILVGTPNIIPTLEKIFTAGRRLTSGGDLHLDRYAIDDDIWKDMITTLWPYQYVNTPTVIYEIDPKSNARNIVDTKLFEEIYRLTQGIPFVFSFLFIHAQMLAMENPRPDGQESIGIKEWRRAYNESSMLIKRAIEDIRHHGGKNYSDLMDAAQYHSGPEKTEFVVTIKKLLSQKSITKREAKALLNNTHDVEDKYVLSDEELKIVERAKQVCLSTIGSTQGQVIEGECGVVK